MRPVLLPPNIIDHFYLGGQHIAELRGVDLPSPRRPEEWVAATVHRAGEPEIGRSGLADGTLFADLVAADPVGWTGTGSAPAGATDVGLLVKLLDAGQRLPVHVHPTRAFAGQHLHSCYGKTEAWYVLAVEGDDPAVWVGWREDVDPVELASRVDAQDSDWMLAHMHKITVGPGDGVLVPAGQPHATGAGVFLIEVQEPTDFSILLEWSVTTATRDESHLDLGFERALTAVDHHATDETRLAALQHHRRPTDRAEDLLRALPSAADPYFRIDVAAPHGAGVSVPAGFAVAIVLDGAGTLGRDGADPEPLERGQAWAVPAGIGTWSVTGEVRVAICRPSADWPELAPGS